MENVDESTKLEKLLEEGRDHQLDRNYGHAEQSYLLALELAKQLHGAESLQAARVLNFLVSVYCTDKKQHRQAKILCKQVIAMGMNGTFTANNEVVITAMNNLAVIHVEHGAFRLAETLLKQVYEAWLEQKGPKHTLTRRALRNLAEFYRRTGKVEPAMTLLGQALTEVLPNLRGPSAPIGSSVNNESEGAQP